MQNSVTSVKRTIRMAVYTTLAGGLPGRRYLWDHYSMADYRIARWSDLRHRLVLTRLWHHIRRIIDGGTFHSDVGRVRLYGVDTPERVERCFFELT